MYGFALAQIGISTQHGSAMTIHPQWHYIGSIPMGDANQNTHTMKVVLTPKESEDLFLDAMCNALNYMAGYGLELDFDEDHYKKVRKEGDCFEDVLMSILHDGGKITLVDIECDGEYSSTITLKDVHEKVQETPIRHLMDAINHQGDGDTSDVILQSVFFGEVVFG